MGNKSKSQDSSIADAIIDTIRSKSDNGKSMELKSLRKLVLIATHHLDNDDGAIDKSMKKVFKGAIQSLETGKFDW
jgi:hypothetical protein